MDAIESWPCDSSEYSLEHLIGRGSFAKVYTATCAKKRSDGVQRVALKVMDLEHINTQIADIYNPQSYLLTAVVSFALMGLLHFFLKYTKIGLAVRAVAQNKDIAYLMGINVPVFISLIFGLACALAAAAGVLIGPMQSVQVEMGYLMLMKAFAAAVVGGFGSLPGALLGGILVGIFENLGAAYISPSHKDIYAFLLLILVLMIRPSGLFGIEAKVKA